MKEGSEGDVGINDVPTSRDADSTVSNGRGKRHLMSPVLTLPPVDSPLPMGGTALANALLGISLDNGRVNGNGNGDMQRSLTLTVTTATATVHSSTNGKGLMGHSNGKGAAAGNGKQFTCPTCDRSFGYKHVLQNHERTHTGEKPFECKECHKRFTRDHHLKTHMRLHTGEKPYHCSHCDRHFVQVANLRRHLRVHTGERPYACELCTSRFSDSNQLKAHILIHKDLKPYFCEKCSGRFRRRHHLVHHKCPMDPANAGKPRRGRRPKAYDAPLLTPLPLPPPAPPTPPTAVVSVIRPPPPAAHMRPSPHLHLHLNGFRHHLEAVQSGPLDMTMAASAGGGQVSVIVNPPRPLPPTAPYHHHLDGVLDLSNSRSDSEAEPIEEEVDEEDDCVDGLDDSEEEEDETPLLKSHHMRGVIACSWFDGLRRPDDDCKGMAAKGKTAI